MFSTVAFHFQVNSLNVNKFSIKQLSSVKFLQPSSNVEIEHSTKTTVTNSERWLQKDYNVVISLHHYIALTFWLSYYLCYIYIYTNTLYLSHLSD